MIRRMILTCELPGLNVPSKIHDEKDAPDPDVPRGLKLELFFKNSNLLEEINTMLKDKKKSQVIF